MKCSCGGSIFIGTVCGTCHIDINDDVANKKALEFENILVLQSDRYDAAAKSTTIDVVNQKLTPNLWLFHTGWDKILKGYVYCDIYNFVHAAPNEMEQQMLDAVIGTLDDVVKKVKQIEPTHQIMSDVQRRTKYQDINARFPFHAFKCDATWVKYFRTMSRLSLVVFRMMEMDITDNDVTNNDDEDNNGDKFQRPNSPNDKRLATLRSNIVKLEEGSERSLLCIEFLLSLVEVTIHREMKNVALLTVFAMISVKKDNSLADAIGTTPVIAAIIASYKMLFLAKCTNSFAINTADNDDDEKNDDDGDESDDENGNSNGNSKSWVKQLHSDVEKHFFINDFGTVHSPITTLVKLFHYGKQVAREQTGIGTIRWENDTVFHRDLSLSITNYRWCIQSGINKITTLLLKLLRYDNCNQLPTIPWKKIVDDHNNHHPNYSFLTDEGNQQWLCTPKHLTSMRKRLSKRGYERRQKNQRKVYC